MNHRTVLLTLASSIALSFAVVVGAQGPPPVVPGELLGSTGAIGADLISIDPTTGAGTSRFPLGSLGPVSEIRFGPDGVLYGTTGGGTANLITIDPDTGAETLVGNYGGGAVTALEFANGVLYGAHFNTGPPPSLGAPTDLVEVDLTDGSLTTIGTISGFSPVRGLAYDATTGTMFGIGISQVANGGDPEGGGSDELFTIDLGTGTPTPVGSTGGFEVGGMTFGPGGLLYGGSAISSTADLGGGAPLLILDTSTGAATVVGDTGSPAISGLAFVPGAGGGGGGILAIPTASHMGLLLLGALLAAAALFVLRRG